MSGDAFLSNLPKKPLKVLFPNSFPLLLYLDETKLITPKPAFDEVSLWDAATTKVWPSYELGALVTTWSGSRLTWKWIGEPDKTPPTIVWWVMLRLINHCTVVWSFFWLSWISYHSGAPSGVPGVESASTRIQEKQCIFQSGLQREWYSTIV